MAGTRRKISIDEKIEKAKKNVTQAKERYDAAVAELEKLMTKKQELQNKELFDAVVKSSKSYEEIMAFLSEKEDE